MATPPRIITPGRTVYLTIQAVNRQFRFAPEKDVVDSINFIFWQCVSTYGMQVHEMVWMSNHVHICLTDVRGVLPRFVCKMNSLLSRQLNTLRGQTGTNFEKGYSDIEIVDEASVLRLCAYTLANPCAADLVSTASAWKGVSTYKLEYNEPFLVTRPNCGLWAGTAKARLERSFRPKGRARSKSAAQERRGRANKGKKAASATKKKGSAKKKANAKPRKRPSELPESVVGVLTRPDIMPGLSDRALRQKIRLETCIRETDAANKRRREGRKVLGWKGVLKHKWYHFPKSGQPLFELNPRIASECDKLLFHSLGRIHTFNQRYEAAFERYLEEGWDAALFPRGTWKMRRTFRARCSRC